MGAFLGGLILDYYEKVQKKPEDSSTDAWEAIEAVRKEVVEEIIREKVDEIDRRAAAAREERLRKEREENAARSMRSFTQLILEAVVLATIVGLIGSHLYGLGEAWWYAPNKDFASLISIGVLAILLLACLSLIMYMFMNSLPDWVEDAIKRTTED